jgi:hypothetical protein
MGRHPTTPHFASKAPALSRAASWAEGAQPGLKDSYVDLGFGQSLAMLVFTRRATPRALLPAVFPRDSRVVTRSVTRYEERL